MKVLCVLLILGCSAFAWPVDKNGIDDQSPYQVSILINDRFSCSGAIVDKQWIVTVASCVDGFTVGDIVIRAGTNSKDQDGILRKVVNILIHPDYNNINYDYDIALLKLNLPLPTSDKIEVIKVAHDAIKEGDKYTVTGWGEDQFGAGGTFKKIEVEVLQFEDCAEAYMYHHVTRNMFCAMNSQSNPCWDDAGDPLVSHDLEIVGLYSWTQDCKKTPGIYTYLAPMANWIQLIVQNN